MIKGSADRLDALLREYFRPEAVPAHLARRALEGGAAASEELMGFARSLGIEATPRGVSLVRATPVTPPATAAARRVAERAREEIVEYLRGQRVFFSVPVDLSEVADFQRKVLEAACHIPFGEARPYAWIAERIGHDRAVRAVGTALGRNPVPLIVPCHRVWRTDGGFGGYLFGAGIKRRLRELEESTPVLEGSARTRIVCRVGCPQSRGTKPEDRVVFASVEDARSVGYRACTVCKPSTAA
jgi:O-6-methylguanine DNA methyltransferase